MSDVSVSVIIPTYKRSKMLCRAIESALTQTYQAIEVIVVDDNDPNSNFRKQTEARMKMYSDDPRVRYIKHSKNKNGAAARNTGIHNARGCYIALLDDDDFFYPTKIEKQVKFLEKNISYDAVYCGRVQNGRNVYGKLDGDLSKVLLLETFTPTTPSLMFRKEVILEIGCFDESYKRHQDYELLLKFFKNHTIGVISEPLVEIGINDGGNEIHGTKLVETKKQFLHSFSDRIEEIDKRNPGFKKQVYCNNIRNIFFDHLSQKYFKEATNMYIKGCTISLFHFNVEIVKYVFKYISIMISRKNKRGCR